MVIKTTATILFITKVQLAADFHAAAAHSAPASKVFLMPNLYIRLDCRDFSTTVK